MVVGLQDSVRTTSFCQYSYYVIETFGNHVWYVPLHFVLVHCINSNEIKQNMAYRFMVLLQEHILLRLLLTVIEYIKKISKKCARGMKRKLIPQNIVMNLVNMILMLTVSLIHTVKMIVAMNNGERSPRKR